MSLTGSFTFKPPIADNWESVLSDESQLSAYTAQWSFSIPIITLAKVTPVVTLRNVRSESKTIDHYDIDGKAVYKRSAVTFVAGSGRAVLEETLSDDTHTVSINYGSAIEAGKSVNIEIWGSNYYSMPISKNYTGDIGIDMGIISKISNKNVPYLDLSWNVESPQWALNDSEINDGYPYIYDLGEEYYRKVSYISKYAWLLDTNKIINEGYPYLAELPTKDGKRGYAYKITKVYCVQKGGG